MRTRLSVLWLTLAVATTAPASEDSLRAAVGGGVGGAAGAYLGSELGGRGGAVAGGALGAAAGAAIATQDQDGDGQGRADVRYGRPVVRAPYPYHHPDDPYGHHPSRFCPPGQAKKGRC